LIRMQIGSRPLPIDIKERELSTLIVKQEGMKREGNQEEVAALEKKIVDLKEELNALRQRWESEKKDLQLVKEKKNKLEQLRFQEEEAERVADYNKVAELRYNTIPAVMKELEDLSKDLGGKKDRLLQEEVDEFLIAQIVAK